MPRLGLIVFHRNEPERVVSTVRRLASEVDETLVVDSSETSGYDSLARQLVGTGARVLRALPVGSTELLRPLAHARSQAEHVVSIDSDEEPSEALIDRLRRPLGSTAAFEVPRLERSLGVVTWHRRIYRPQDTEYQGWIHETPTVHGRVERLHPDQCLIHHADYSAYLQKGTRGQAYLRIETLERPFTPASLQLEFVGSRFASLAGRGDSPIARSTAWTILAAWRTGRWLTRGRPVGARRLSHYFDEYLRARYRRFYALSREERREAAMISAELRAAGGPISYLGFGEPDYVDRLTRSFGWDRDGGEVVEELLRFRRKTGEPMTRWAPCPGPGVAP